MFLGSCRTFLITILVIFLSLPVLAETSDAEVDIELIIEALEDDSRRDALIKALKSSIDPTAESTLEEDAESDTPLFDQFVDEISTRVSVVGAAITALKNVVSQIPRMGQWLKWQTESTGARAAWLAALGVLGPALALGAIAALLLHRWLIPLHRRHVHEERFPAFTQALGNLAIDCLPLLLFGVTAEAVLALEQPPRGLLEITRAVVFAVIAHEVIRACVRYAFGRDGHQALVVTKRRVSLPLASGIVRASAVAIYGHALVTLARVMGLPWEGVGVLSQILGLIVAIILAMTILRLRRMVVLHPDAEHGRLRDFGRILLRHWSWIALFYLAMIYGVWALSIKGGFFFLLSRGTGSLALLFLMRTALVRLRRRATPHEDDIDADDTALEFSEHEPEPKVEAEVDQRYFSHFLKMMTWVGTFWVLAELWGLNVTRWLMSSEGESVSHALFNVLLIIISYFALITITHWIAQTIAGSGTDEVSNRRHTLAVIGHNVIRVMASVTAFIMILSEIGFNVAPLLAGAGVIGLAVGFGAQRLVQDIITGFFILIEDTLSVGDVVDLGGHNGVVEALTIRSVRLRDYSGNVHTIPFSSIDSVTNMTKDYSFAVLELGVDYTADIEEVMKQMEKVARQLRIRPETRREIIGPFELAGVEALGDSAVVIKGRIRVRPGSQWAVKRAFHLAIKRAFDEAGITIPFPHMTIEMKSAAMPSPPEGANEAPSHA